MIYTPEEYFICYEWKLTIDVTTSKKKHWKHHTEQVIGHSYDQAKFVAEQNLKKRRNTMNFVVSAKCTGVAFAFHNKTLEHLPGSELHKITLLTVEEKQL